LERLGGLVDAVIVDAFLVDEGPLRR